MDDALRVRGHPGHSDRRMGGPASAGVPALKRGVSAGLWAGALCLSAPSTSARADSETPDRGVAAASEICVPAPQIDTRGRSSAHAAERTESSAQSPTSEAVGRGELVRACRGMPCTRSNIARIMLGGIGTVALAAGAGLLLALPRAGEPGGWLAGTGAVAWGGAVVGAFFGLVTREWEPLQHGISAEEATFNLRLGVPSSVHLGERMPPTASLGWAPALRIPSTHSIIRIHARLGGLLGRSRSVQPTSIPENGGTAEFQTAQTSSHGHIALGLDWTRSVAYGTGRRKLAAHLGPVDLRFRPSYEFRREIRRPQGLDRRAVDRHMILPLTLGIRWHVSARQSFSASVGPRLDLTGYALADADGWTRHGPRAVEWGRVYGDAWYEIDFPLTSSRGPRAVARRFDAAGRLIVGYRHSTFDGLALNAGAVVGFTGPLYLGWATRWTRRADPSAPRPGRQTGLQLAMGVWIADEPRFHVDLGLALPEIQPASSKRSRRSHRP